MQARQPNGPWIAIVSYSLALDQLVPLWWRKNRKKGTQTIFACCKILNLPKYQGWYIQSIVKFASVLCIGLPYSYGTWWQLKKSLITSIQKLLNIVTARKQMTLHLEDLFGVVVLLTTLSLCPCVFHLPPN